MKNPLIQPVVKWVGGKRQLINEINQLIPMIPKSSKYYEPFAGGAAVLFSLEPKKAVINDRNEELVNVYNVIKNSVEELIQQLEIHKVNNCEEYFYELRALDRTEGFKEKTNVERAARFIYLNKTCFNGLYRVNLSGYFNSPYGKYKNPNIVNEEVLRAVNKYLNKNDIVIMQGDFEQALNGIRKGSFVYFDPPYDPVSDSSNFTGYTSGGFGKDEQERLKAVCDRLHKKGVKFLLSNSNTEYIRNLYGSDNYNIKIVNASRNINSVGTKRGDVEEVLIYNYLE